MQGTENEINKDDNETRKAQGTDNENNKDENETREVQGTENDNKEDEAKRQVATNVNQHARRFRVSLNFVGRNHTLSIAGL